MTDNEKIKFVDTILEKFREFIEEEADKDMRPMEYDDEDENGNIIRRYFPTSFQFRKEVTVEDLCMQAEDLFPFAFDMFEYLGFLACNTPMRKENQFMELHNENIH